MKHFYVLWSTLCLQMKNSFARPMFRFCLLANPIVNTVLMYEMFQSAGQENFTTYVILGAGLMGLWSCICFSSAGDINRERFCGTLPLIFSTPARFSSIILGKIVGNTLLSLITLILSFLTALLLYGIWPEVQSPGFLMLSLFAAILCFVSISSIIAYLLTLSRKTQLYMNCIEIPVILLCGFAFPLEVLPRWIQPLSFALSPTWAVKLIRMSVGGVADAAAYWTTLGILAAMTAAYTLAGALLARAIDNQVRIKATLEVM